jgi:hypothetical protein
LGGGVSGAFVYLVIREGIEVDDFEFEAFWDFKDVAAIIEVVNNGSFGEWIGHDADAASVGSPKA